MKDILTKEESLKLYSKLVLARFSEEAIRREYHKDEMKTPVHLGIGGEAIPIGVCHALPKGSKAFGTYRNHTLYLALSEDTDGFFGEMYGKVSGPGKGKAGSMHLSHPESGLMATSAVVGTNIPLAVGAAFANAYRKSDDIAVVFFGDGSVEEGAFWESLNFASHRRLRILFVCEDNQLAIHTPAKSRQGFKSIRDVVRAFNCHMGHGNGSDLLDVVQTAHSVVKNMREEAGPGFLHFDYFRFLEHVGPREDFDAGYRQKPTAEELQKLDPLKSFESVLLENGCTREELTQIDEHMRIKIDQSIENARKAPFPSPEELRADVYT